MNSAYEFYRSSQTTLPITIKAQVSDHELIQTVVAVEGMCEDAYPFRDSSQMLRYWLGTESAQWILDRAIEQPICFQKDNPIYESTEFYITVKLRQKDAVIWQLKWGTQDLTQLGF